MGRGGHGWHGGFYGHGACWGPRWGPGPGLLLGEAALLGAGAGYLAAGGGGYPRRGRTTYVYAPPVQTTYQVVQPQDQLIVALHAASGVRDTGWLARQDVCALISVSRGGSLVAQAKTCVVPAGGDTPVFDGRRGATLAFALPPGAAPPGASPLDGVVVSVRLFAVHNVSPDTTLGAAYATAAHVADGVVRDYRIQPAGTLTMTIHHVVNGLDAAQARAQQAQQAPQAPQARPAVAEAAPLPTAYPVDQTAEEEHPHSAPPAAYPAEVVPPPSYEAATGSQGRAAPTTASAPPLDEDPSLPSVKAVRMGGDRHDPPPPYN